MKLATLTIPKSAVVCLLCCKPLMKGEKFIDSEQLVFSGVQLMCCEEHFHFAENVMQTIQGIVAAERHNLETTETHTE